MNSTDINQSKNIVNLDQARRRHERLPAAGRVVAQVIEAEDEALVGLTFHSNILEVSPCGMRLTTDTDFDGCRLDLWVEITGQPGKMFLTTEVRWTSKELQGYQLGVEIVMNPLSDISQWCDFQRKEWFQDKARELQQV